MNKAIGFLAVLVATMAFCGCSTAPKDTEAKSGLHEDVNTTLDTMKRQDNTLNDFLDKSQGYVVFPTITEGAAVVGGAHGRGEVYAKGADGMKHFIGYADVSKATFGAQIGGQNYTEIIAFEDSNTLEKFKQGEVKFDATASAVALTAGAAATARFTNGIAVFTKPKEGLMAQASIGGQSFRFQPAERP